MKAQSISRVYAALRAPEKLPPDLIAYWTNFRLATLARINLSFVPMVQMVGRCGVEPRTIGSFGSGSCTHEVALAHLYPEATVLCHDITREHIPEYTNDAIRSMPNISFVEMNLTALPSSTFEFVLSIQRLEHIEDYEAALANLARAVAAKGYLYVDTPLFHERPDLEPKVNELKALAWERHSHHHLGFSRRGMEERLRDHGFQIVDSGYYAYHAFDRAFMGYLRSTAGRSMADDPVIREMVRAYTLMLEGAEEAYRGREDELDALSVAERKCFAIRVLGRKAS